MTTGNKHRSAQGKLIDMAVIAAMNEKTRAVGNMKINARGDEIDSFNRIVKPRGQRVQENRYSGPTTPENVSNNFSGLAADTPVAKTAPIDEPEEELTQAELELEKELNEEQVPAKPGKTNDKESV
jgi:hypothetical protein